MTNKTLNNRGFYKPKSYRFSEENKEFLTKLSKEFGSYNLAIEYLKKIHKKNGLEDFAKNFNIKSQTVHSRRRASWTVEEIINNKREVPLNKRYLKYKKMIEKNGLAENKYSDIIKRYLGINQKRETFDDIAVDYKLTRERIRQLLNEGLFVHRQTIKLKDKVKKAKLL